MKILPADISIIIPVLYETERISDLIANLRLQSRDCEIIVVDGDSAGSTIEMINDPTVIKVTTEKGRGVQLREGFELATKNIVVMLHADTILPSNGLELISQAVNNGSCWGAFRLGIDGKSILYRIIERSVDIRTSLFSLPYGDQAIFATKDALRNIGGIPNISIMEDVVIARSLKRLKGRCKVIPLRALTSARRWEKRGIIRQTLLNWSILFKFLNGAEPEALKKVYK